MSGMFTALIQAIAHITRDYPQSGIACVMDTRPLCSRSMWYTVKVKSCPMSFILGQCYPYAVQADDAS